MLMVSSYTALGRWVFIYLLILHIYPFSLSSADEPASKVPTHGISPYGDLKYSAEAPHLDYVNPEAPKGGILRRGAVGTFDSLNPFIIKGDPAGGLHPLHGGIFYAALTLKSNDEPLSEYGYIAEKIELAQDKKVYHLYPPAGSCYSHDGSPIRPEDVIFTFNTLMEKGSPTYKGYYYDIQKVEKTGVREVTFSFKDAHNKELPIIIGELPIISEKFYKNKNFESPSLEIPPGTGPYKIIHIDPGRSITYERVENWWGESLLIAKGRYNFQRIKFIYFSRYGSLF